MINQKLEELKEKFGVTKYTFVKTLDEPSCYGPIDYFVDDKSISPVKLKNKNKKYVFSFKRRYHVSPEENVPSEYGVMCFYCSTEEKDQVYYYYPDSKKLIIGDSQIETVGVANMLDEENRVTILINHVLKKIKNSNFL
jgi:hypothetical protein